MTKDSLMPVVDGATSAIWQVFALTIPRIQLHVIVFKQHLMQWIVQSHISFQQVEEPTVQLLLSSLTSV